MAAPQQKRTKPPLHIGTGMTDSKPTPTRRFQHPRSRPFFVVVVFFGHSIEAVSSRSVGENGDEARGARTGMMRGNRVEEVIQNRKHERKKKPSFPHPAFHVLTGSNFSRLS